MLHGHVIVKSSRTFIWSSILHVVELGAGDDLQLAVQLGVQSADVGQGWYRKDSSYQDM